MIDSHDRCKNLLACAASAEFDGFKGKFLDRLLSWATSNCDPNHPQAFAKSFTASRDQEMRKFLKAHPSVIHHLYDVTYMRCVARAAIGVAIDSSKRTANESVRAIRQKAS